jgi:hypothetical protein
MSIRTVFFVLSLFFGAAYFAAIAVHSAAPPKQLDLSYEFRESTITLHEPVILRFKVHNELEQSVALDLGVNKVQSFEFVLMSPQGQTIQGRHQVSEGLSTLVGKLPIQPGEHYQQELILNQWFEFDTPGRYVLTAQLNTVIDVGGMGTSAPPAQHLELEIKPRDVQRLTKLCAELAKQVETAQSVEAAQFPALTLSYVGDPVAVPYLAQVIRAHTLAYDRAIPGLEKIGTDEAVEVLLSALNENWGDIPELATRSLARMQDRIANPRLKETVKKAVERSSARARNEFIKEQIAYLDYRDATIQDTAIQNLMKVEGGLRQAEPILRRLANDPNQPADVRTAAKDALQRLHPNE